MPDYEEMYRILFDEMTEAILRLQAAQQRTEELFMDDNPDDHLILFGSGQDEDEEA